MTKVIWKFALPTTTAEFPCEMPAGAELIAIREQANRICIWAMVDPSEKNRDVRRFVQRNTGDPVPEDGTYLGTALLSEGRIARHIFEVGREDWRNQVMA